MKNFDAAGGLIVLLLGGIICYEAIGLGVGSLAKPGTGFMSFLTGALLVICGGILFVRSVTSEKIRNGSLESVMGAGWKRAGIVTVSMIVYAALLPSVGYLICTFLLLGLLFNLYVVKGWFLRLFGAAAITLLTFYAFRVLLGCPLPRGVFSFGF